jgi:hypothetical protein
MDAALDVDGELPVAGDPHRWVGDLSARERRSARVSQIGFGNAKGHPVQLFMIRANGIDAGVTISRS